ncbi:MAG TPA: hypothetical protein VF069_05335 [Streptosporangiaceae bacterium]
MAERDSGWVSGGVVDAEDARLATGVLAMAGAGPIQTRTGLKPGPGNPGLVQATATPSSGITVQPFQAVIQGTRLTAAGSYLVTLDQVKTVAVPPAHPSNPRLDLIVARQRDQQYGDESSGMTVECVSGTPAAAPVPPPVPGDYVVLAQLTVRAGAGVISSTDITDRRSFAVAAGGVLPLLPHETPPAQGFDGQRVYDLETGQDLVWRAAGWRPAVAGTIQAYGPADSGWPRSGTTTGNTPLVTNQVTIPPAPFPRLLYYTTQVLVGTSTTTNRFDHTVIINGVAERVSAFHGGATSLTSVGAAGQYVLASGTTPLIVQSTVTALTAPSTATVGELRTRYNAINVLAIPL